MQAAQPPHVILSEIYSSTLAGMQRGMRGRNKPKFVRTAGQRQKRFDIALNVVIIDFSLGDTPLLLRRRAGCNTGDDRLFQERVVTKPETVPKFKYPYP